MNPRPVPVGSGGPEKKQGTVFLRMAEILQTKKLDIFLI
jgi:hypothetical protein